MNICIVCKKAYPKKDKTIIICLGLHHDRRIFICEDCVRLCTEGIKEHQDERSKSYDSQ